MGCSNLMRFRRVSSKDWSISDSVSPKRRSRLLRETFPKIVELLCTTLKSVTARRAKNRCPVHGFPPKSLVRTELTIYFPRYVVDLFHNGAGGYRAQYYLSPKLGDHANAVCCKRLLAAVESERALHPRYQDGKSRRSLNSVHAKVWIGQGRWLWERRIAVRNLTARRWAQAEAKNKRAKQFQIWAKLMPSDEDRIRLFGAWVEQSTGRPIGRPSKSNRAEEISKIGFT